MPTSPTFRANTTYPVGQHPESVTAADVNQDGKLDFVVGHSNGGVAVPLGIGDGGFDLPTTYDAGPSASSMTTADLNGDGKLDLVVVDFCQSVTVLLADGNGGFGTPTPFARCVWGSDWPHTAPHGQQSDGGVLLPYRDLRYGDVLNGLCSALPPALVDDVLRHNPGRLYGFDPA